MVSRAEHLAHIKVSYNNARFDRVWGYTQTASAAGYWAIPNDHEAIGSLIDAMWAMLDCVAELYDYTYPEWGEYAVPDFLDHYAVAAEPFTMGLLIAEMLTASADEVEFFIGLVDAYRQGIWNRPFNHELFTALGRGFMEWP